MPELTLRDAMVLIGSLLILAVIVDAWRRMRQQNRAQVRMKLAPEVSAEGTNEDLSMFRELPNGGARVVRRDDDFDDELLGGGGAAPAADEQAPTEYESAVVDPPVTAPLGAPAARATANGEEPAAATPAVSDPTPAPDGASAASASQGASSQSPVDEEEVFAGVTARDDEPTNLDWLEDLPEQAASMHDDSGGELPRDSNTEVIVLHVMARDDRGFSGGDILEILLACDLRFGDMNFFHRHEQQAGRGPIQFSVANMLQPGVFDIDAMDSMRTRGLVFFVTLPGPEDMIQAYDYMLETARVVAKNLNGELLDESRSVLTQQAVEHSRQQIRELERRLMAHGA
ncbi:MAG: cell division protein ZipA [Pseudomonadota bacterium]